MGYLVFKRFIDIAISLMALIVLIPVFIVVGIFIKLDSKGPVFFLQDRLGVDGKRFKIFKLRSMYLGAEKLGVYELKDDPRVTPVGRFIRPLSINELPQFINILKGDMSLIGPRPVLPDHPWDWSQATELQRKRFKVRPGLTGWAAVNGRKNVTWEMRTKYEAEYAENISFMFDLKIFLKTISVVLSMKDGYNKEIPVKSESIDDQKSK